MFSVSSAVVASLIIPSYELSALHLFQSLSNPLTPHFINEVSRTLETHLSMTQPQMLLLTVELVVWSKNVISKSSSMYIFLLAVVLSIHLDCFIESCRVLETSSVEMSVFSQV